MSKRHRFLNKVIGRQSITAEDALENNTLAGDGTAETPLGTVRIRILAARGLEGKDRNGKSDPFFRFRAAHTGLRLDSDVVKACLSPVWGQLPPNVEGKDDLVTAKAGKEFAIEFPLYPHNVAQANFECVFWDKDRLSKNDYLGEVTLALEDWFTPAEDGHVPVDYSHPEIQPKWHHLRSSRTGRSASGEVLYQVGFVTPSTPHNLTTPGERKSTAPQLPSALPLTPEKQKEISAYIGRVLESKRAARTSLAERVLERDPTRGVGTVKLGAKPVLERRGSSQSILSDDSSSSLSSSDDGTETEADSFTDVSDLSDLEDNHVLGDEPIRNPHASAPAINIPIHSGMEDPTLDEDLLTPRDATARERPASPLNEDDLITPRNVNAATQKPSYPISMDGMLDPSSAETKPVGPAAATVPDAPAQTPARSSSRSSLGLPTFMKRKSAQSVTTMSSLSMTSDANSSSTSDLQLDEDPLKKKKRFGKIRRATKSSGDLAGEGSEADVPTRPKRTGKRSKKRMGRRRREESKSYSLSGNDILGICFLEVKNAKNLPRWKNVARVSFDMDPFVIVSFGQKVFRTRVIRHDLNPVFDEKLFFHVRKHEEAYNVQFSLYDWDKASSNDHVGDTRFDLSSLMKEGPKAREDGLYTTDKDGFLHSDFAEMKLPIEMGKPLEQEKSKHPELSVRAKFIPYAALRQQFWRQYSKQFDTDESGSFTDIQLFAMLDSLGSTLSRKTIDSFFHRHDKSTSDALTMDQVVACLEHEVQKHSERAEGAATTAPSSAPQSGYTTPAASLQDNKGGLGFTGAGPSKKGSVVPTITAAVPSGIALEGSKDVPVGPAPDAAPSTSENNTEDEADAIAEEEERVISIKTCPLCHKPRMGRKSEVDIITHLAICASQDWTKFDSLMVSNFVTSSQAHRKWLGKLVSRVTKGVYQLGADSSNILVQNRLTGQLQEEKMQVYVRLGIRLGYRGMTGVAESQRIKKLFKSMTLKQGIKYDSEESAAEILPFIAFHGLDMGEVLDPIESFKTFNQFFYRKLKPGARPAANPGDNKTLVSCADCRMMVFPTVNDATRIWIKGTDFSLKNLLGPAYAHEADKYEGGSIAIFRLAPQDYHRMHSPVEGVIGKCTMIPGDYYTVNPIAVRSRMDIYGINAREIVPIDSGDFGRVFNVWVGAMLVGSINRTVKQGQHVERAQEVGYFAFGGSTVVLCFLPHTVRFDADLVENSSRAIETLVRVGMQIGRRV